jgi:hypothetical protein
MFRKVLFAIAAMGLLGVGAGTATADHCHHGGWGGFYGPPPRSSFYGGYGGYGYGYPRTVVRSYYGSGYGSPYYGGHRGYGYGYGGPRSYYGGSRVSFSIGF